jgi:hypothetical protein
LRALSVILPVLALVALVGHIRVGRGDAERQPEAPRVTTPMTRLSLRVDAFGTPSLPRTLPTVRRNWRDARFAYAARIDRLTVTLKNGFTSVAYDLWPRDWNGRTLIFHNGHRQDLDASLHVLKWFLARRWRVVTMAMPLAGQNSYPSRFGDPRGLHNDFVRLPRPLGVFVEPVVAVVNYTRADTMVGLSGGGWTTVLAAAIDSRIVRSYSVAGTIPRRSLCEPAGSGCEGDFEQWMIPNYLPLYELGSERGRRQMALYNLDDPCCFAGSSSRIWAPRVRGNFDAVIDETSDTHAVTTFHLRLITRDLRRPPRPPRS